MYIYEHVAETVMTDSVATFVSDLLPHCTVLADTVPLTADTRWWKPPFVSLFDVICALI